MVEMQEERPQDSYIDATSLVTCVATFSCKDARPRIPPSGSALDHNDDYDDDDDDESFGTVLRRTMLQPPPAPVWHVSFSRDGKYLATCHAAPENCIRIWTTQQHHFTTAMDTSVNSKPSLPSWQFVATLEGVHERTIRRAEFGPGYVIASASYDGTVCIWEYNNSNDKDGHSGDGEGGSSSPSPVWECTAQLEGHENEVKCVAWNCDGSLLATCGRDKSVWIWECLWNGNEGEFECVAVLTGHDADVKSVIWIDKQQYGRGEEGEEWLVSTSYDDTLRVWADDDGDWYCVYTLDKGHGNTIWDVTPHYSSAVSTSSATGRNSNSLRLVSASQDGSLCTWQFVKQQSSASASSSDNHKLLPSSSEEAAWQSIDKTEDAHAGPVLSIHSNSSSFENDSRQRYIVSGGGDNTINLYREDVTTTSTQNDSENEIENKVPITKLNKVARLLGAHQGDVNCVRWCPRDPTTFFSCGDDGNICVWNVDNSE
jgi:WD40 repeat protein